MTASGCAFVYPKSSTSWMRKGFRFGRGIEMAAYGIDFPPPAERVAMLEEAANRNRLFINPVIYAEVSIGEALRDAGVQSVLGMSFGAGAAHAASIAASASLARRGSDRAASASARPVARPS